MKRTEQHEFSNGEILSPVCYITFNQDGFNVHRNDMTTEQFGKFFDVVVELVQTYERKREQQALILYRFKDYVYAAPFAPFYDSYKGHTFRIHKCHEGNHLELVCTDDPKIKIGGWIHSDDIEPVE